MWPFYSFFHIYIYFYIIFCHPSLLCLVYFDYLLKTVIKNLIWFSWPFLRLSLQETLHVWPSFPRATFISCYDPLMVQRLCYYPVGAPAVIRRWSCDDVIIPCLLCGEPVKHIPFFWMRICLVYLWAIFFFLCSDVFLFFLLGCDSRMSSELFYYWYVDYCYSMRIIFLVI